MANKSNNLKIGILNESAFGELPLGITGIRKAIRKAIRTGGLSPALCDVSLLIVDDDAMRRLNREYRGLNRTTDVLSFPQFASREEIGLGPDGRILLGDVVISLQTLHRRCKKRNENHRREFAVLLVHGVLHLIGYDHDSAANRNLMRGLEAVLVDTI